MPGILEHLRTAQITPDLVFQLCLRDHRIERWLAAGILVWPDSMTPVNVLDSSLICHPFCKRERSLRILRPAEGRSTLNRQQLRKQGKKLERVHRRKRIEHFVSCASTYAKEPPFTRGASAMSSLFVADKSGCLRRDLPET